MNLSKNSIYNFFFKITFFELQWDLKCGLVWILNGQKKVGLHLLNGIWCPEAQPFEVPTNDSYFVKNPLNSRQKCPDFERSGFQMAGTIALAMAWPFEDRTI